MAFRSNPLRLHRIPDASSRALNAFQGASNSLAGIKQGSTTETITKKTAGGAALSGVSTAATGAMIGSYVIAGSAGGPIGAALGAVVGIGAYMLS